MSGKLEVLWTSVLIYLIPQDLCLSLRMIQIKNMFTTFSNYSRRRSLSEKLVFSLTLTSFSKYSISFWFTLLQNKKEADIMVTRLVSLTKPKRASVNIQPRSRVDFCLLKYGRLHFRKWINSILQLIFLFHDVILYMVLYYEQE